MLENKVKDNGRSSADKQTPKTGAAETDYNYKETEWLLLTQLGHGKTIWKEHRLVGLKCTVKCSRKVALSEVLMC